MSEEEYGHEQPEHDAQEFKCPMCGGQMAYDASDSQMKCAHCGHAMVVGAEEGDQAIVEYNLEDGLAKATQKGYGTPVRSSQCNECGAKVSFSESETATDCVYCGSSQVLQQEENRNVLRPESVVPFNIARADASSKFSGWLSKLWFRPSALKNEAKVSEMNGVYVPYWTFDSQVHSDWTAQAGHHYYVNESYTDSEGNSKTRRVQKTNWVPAWGQRDDFYDDVLICASKGLPANLVGKLKSFNTEELQPYQPSFLAGWKAEEYAIELNDGWKTAVGQMEAEQRTKCSNDVPGDTQRGLSVTNKFYDETFKHVLLPIWISAYRFNGKVYRFLVNGQTGEVTGKAPWSFWKIFLFILTIVAIIVGIVVLVKMGGGGDKNGG
jgi:ribosomal protein S27E